MGKITWKKTWKKNRETQGSRRARETHGNYATENQRDRNGKRMCRKYKKEQKEAELQARI